MEWIVKNTSLKTLIEKVNKNLYIKTDISETTRCLEVWIKKVDRLWNMGNYLLGGKEKGVSGGRRLLVVRRELINLKILLINKDKEDITRNLVRILSCCWTRFQSHLWLHWLLSQFLPVTPFPSVPSPLYVYLIRTHHGLYVKDRVLSMSYL